MRPSYNRVAISTYLATLSAAFGSVNKRMGSLWELVRAVAAAFLEEISIFNCGTLAAD